MSQPPPEYEAFLVAADALRHRIREAADESRTPAVTVGELGSSVAIALAAGWALPEVEPHSDRPLASSVSHEEWRTVFAGLGRWIGAAEYYATTFDLDPVEPREVTTGSVADDLADIWRELSDVVEGARRGADWTDVLWEARFGLKTHWGKHAVEVLRALHGRGEF